MLKDPPPSHFDAFTAEMPPSQQTRHDSQWHPRGDPPRGVDIRFAAGRRRTCTERSGRRRSTLSREGPPRTVRHRMTTRLPPQPKKFAVTLTVATKAQLAELDAAWHEIVTGKKLARTQE